MALYEIDLACGQLAIDTTKELLPLDDLLGFASRRNPKRGFLFVSKVLGKHIPCAPKRMREVYDCLAEPLSAVPGPILIIGMAETATGLGGGVADSLATIRATTDGNQVIYQHTTRHRVDADVLLRFDEAHSHAPDHIVYAPDPDLSRDYYDAETLVLVDDEITTGRTLKLLADAMRKHLPRLQRVIFVSIANWLDEATQERIRQALSLDINFISILDGRISFERNPAYAAELPGQVVAQREAIVRADTGRCGLRMGQEQLQLLIPAVPTLDQKKPVYVIGTGELGFMPFLFAEQLEEEGFTVYYQSSTRSPILQGGAIQSSIVFDDEHGEGVTNYLHNPPRNSQALVIYETRSLTPGHDLVEQLGAFSLFLPERRWRTRASA